MRELITATEANNWEFSVERQLPLKRSHAYRVAVDRIDEWWWHPSSRSVTNVRINLQPDGLFKVSTDEPKAAQEGIVLSVRPGWYFYITDALHTGGIPATPTMVGSWTFESHADGFAKHVARIRHFTEDAYRANLARGLKDGWNDAADRLVGLCKEGISATKLPRL